MIIGIGTDLVLIQRIEKLWLEHGQRFADRILSEKELMVFSTLKEPTSYLAKRFAGKEAFAKALGTGIGKEVSFHDLSLLNDPEGKPVVVYSADLALRLQAKGIRNTHISLSDENDHALAFVILEG